MTASRSPLDVLRSIHDALWDEDRGMDRFAPGVAPGVDLSSLDLHSVRETALGAYLDLDDGKPSRALVAIRQVLDVQFPDSTWPWSGTFPTSAEQATPPGDDAIEWVHYDPNWRQFLGCILALITLDHGAVIPMALRHDIDDAMRRAVRGEPEQRIAEWYTNPNLMHAWLQAHVGDFDGDTCLSDAAAHRAHRCFERFEQFGDVDEYNSPTYDGIDLFALALWVRHPPSPTFREWGAAMLAAVGRRIAALYHPELGVTCGPYIRAYGLQPTRYVSLVGIWLHVLGEPSADVLPLRLDATTDHVHDLYFLAVFRTLAPTVGEHLRSDAVAAERTHVQRFEGSVATSVLRPGLAVGWEHGRRHEDSLDQYVPFCAHVGDSSATSSVGAMVPSNTAWIDCTRIADTGFELRASGRAATVGIRFVGAGSGTPNATIDGNELVLGPVVVHVPSRPHRFDVRPTLPGKIAGWTADLEWDVDDIVVSMTVVEPSDENGSVG